MGTTTPRALQNAAFFIVGEMFSLRGGQELRELKLSQVVRHDNPDRYEYTEHVSKTRFTYKVKSSRYMDVPKQETGVPFLSWIST